MKEIKFTKTFEKSFLKLNAELQGRIFEKLDWLKNWDDNIDVKKMQPKYLWFYRLRVWKYRIIFEIENWNEIKLLDVDNRDSIYLK